MPAIPTITELLDMEVSDLFDDDVVPEGPHDAILTDIEVRPGKKAPYLNVKATLFGGEYDRRVVFGISSFSEKALKMPGGVANLIQVVQPEVPVDTAAEELPAVLAEACLAAPVVITVEHEQSVKNGSKQFNDDGTPKMRPRIRAYSEPSEEFVAAFEVEASGGDDDLPF